MQLASEYPASLRKQSANKRKDRAHSVAGMVVPTLVWAAAAAVSFKLWQTDNNVAGAMVIGVTSLAVFTHRPILGLCLLGFVLPFETLWAIVPGQVTASKGVGLVTGLAFVLRLLVGKERIAPVLPELKGYLFLAVWALICLLANWYMPEGGSGYLTLLQSVLLVLIILTVCRDQASLDWLWASIAVGAVVGSVYLLFGDPLALTAQRLTMGFEDENANDPKTFARIQAIGLISIGYLWWRLAHHPILRLVLLPMAGLVVLTIFNSGSRGCLVALMFAGCAMVLSTRRSGLHGPVVLVVVSLVVCLVMLWAERRGMFNSASVDRFKTIGAMTADDVQRLPIWRVGVTMGLHNPVFGVGYWQFPRDYMLYVPSGEPYYPRSPHSAYIGMFAELGIPGLAVFLWLLYRLFKRARGVRWPLLNGLMVASVAFIAISAITDHSHYKKGTYLLYAVVLATSVLTSRRLQRPSSPPSAHDDRGLPGQSSTVIQRRMPVR